MGDEPRDWTPRPDPTILTTEALHREIMHLREHLETLLELHSKLDSEKFANIDQRFKDRDLLVNQAFVNSREAVAAALAASKEAVAKSEKATAKQIDDLQTLIKSQDRAVDEKIEAIKDLYDKAEAKRAALNQLIVIGISVVGVMAAVATVLITFQSR